jgi:hypothetical protein
VADTALVRYVDEVVAEADAALHRSLVAAHVVGSVANGDVRGQASDLDLLLVVGRCLDPDLLRRAGERLADLAGDCPMRGLEAVAYRRDVLAHPRYPLPYELNCNGGRAIPRHVATAGDPGFWFLLDVAAAPRARPHPLRRTGPGPRRPGPRRRGAARLRDSLRWHRTAGGTGPDAVLNACRAWHWLDHGEWLSKTAAGEWTCRRTGTPAVVRAAVAARRAGNDADLDARAVTRFAEEVLGRVERHDRHRAGAYCTPRTAPTEAT